MPALPELSWLVSGSGFHGFWFSMGRKFGVSHANGDLLVADVLLVQLQLGCGGTAVPCPLSASFHGSCTLSVPSPGRSNGF